MTRQPTHLYENLSRDFFDNASSGFVIATAEGYILDVNQTLLNWLGYRHDQLIGKKTFADLLAAGGRIYYNTHHRPVLELRDELQEVAYDMIHAEGQRKPVLVNSKFYQKTDDNRRMILFVISSYVDRGKYEEELRIAKDKADLANRSKATFVSNVSHEIRTPIHAIRSAADFLLRQNPRADQEEWLRVLLDNAHSLTQLVNDVLDFHKLEEGKVTLVTNPFNLKQLLSGIIGNFRMQQINLEVDLLLDVQEGIPAWFVGDSLKVRQVITNLVGNALKFTKEGEVRLELRGRALKHNGYRLAFRVSDTGIGLSEENKERIFNPYVQANARIEHDFGGTGLGLSICYNILKAFGSELVVDSVLGEGSVFHFELELPVAKPESYSEELDVRRYRDYEKLPGLRVLAVDDNLSNILIISRYLDMWGVEYVTATDGMTAFKLITERKFDIVLMDLRMPVLNGYQTAAKVRALSNEYYQSLPIVAVSATASSVLSAKMEQAGFDGLVAKPFEPNHLYEVLSKYSSGKVTAGEEERIVDFTTLSEMYDHDHNDIKVFLEAVEADIRTAISDLEQSDHPTVKLVKDTRHKLKSISMLLQLDALTAQIEKTIVSLEKDISDVSARELRGVVRLLYSVLKEIAVFNEQSLG